MNGHRIKMNINNNEVETFEDIIPEENGFKMLFIGKAPTPDSVKAGHYFHNNPMFWNKLKNYNLLTVQRNEWDDDSLIRHNYGMTDIIRIPRIYGKEPSDWEYKQGIDRILNLITNHKPKITVFLYKKVLDKILELKYNHKTKSKYGFNPSLNHLFGTKVFVFPMPGTPCTREEAHLAMTKLVEVIAGV